MKVTQFFHSDEDDRRTCFHVVTEASITVEQAKILEPFLQEIPGQSIFVQNPESERDMIEVGTRPASVTPWSSNAVSILRDCGLPVVRIESTRQLVVPPNLDREYFVAGAYDRMTECHYPTDDRNFLLSYLNTKPEPVFTVPVLERGVDVLRETSQKYGLAFDEGLISHFVQLFHGMGRDPTIIELFQIGQMCSDHSRHITWNARLILDGEERPYTLFDLARDPYRTKSIRGNKNDIIAFHDNGSAIRGFRVSVLKVDPDKKYVESEEHRHIVCSCETHNYPSSVSPFQGSLTGGTGNYRDPTATGIGAVIIHSSTGFCTGFPRIKGYSIPGEEFVPDVYPDNLASPLQIMLEAPAGAWTGGNQCGIPVLQGFTRAIELMVGEGDEKERYGFLKTLMYAGSLGYILDEHTNKGNAEKGMLIIQFGGPAFPVGLGGAAGSSQILGSQDTELDFNAVQRGNPQMAHIINNVIRRCVELGKLNPIVVITDQGAGGPCNALTELIAKMGGKVRLYKINLGDPTMSTVQIWCAEYQERQAILIREKDLALFQLICEEEDCPFEILGEVTDNGRITVFATLEDENKGTACVDLPITEVLTGLPETVIKDDSTKPYKNPLVIPVDLSFESALKKVLHQVDVGSKAYLVHRVDRSVGGFVARQQCCGPLQLPVADVAVSALTHLSTEGVASSLGEQPLVMMLDQAAGARIAFTEAITNLMSARVTCWEDLGFLANYMWAARSPGGMCKLYRAAESLAEFTIALGHGQSGGKDSSSMAVKMGDQLIKSPEALVIKIFAPIRDITKVVTPDIKFPGQSTLIHIDLSNGKRRLGGSALAQALGQLGDAYPDMEDPELLIRTFDLAMKLIDEDKIKAYHDTTSDGLAVTLLEMAFSGNCGLEADILGSADIMAECFAKEPGAIVEVLDEDMSGVLVSLSHSSIPAWIIGKTSPKKIISLSYKGEEFFEAGTDELRQTWSESSYQFERLQINPECADAEKKNTAIGRPPVYELSFVPKPTAPEILVRPSKPKAAILRDVGTNGEREMGAAFTAVGFEAHDVLMKSLISGKQTLDGFSGLVFPGGFTFMDAFGAGKGWALKIRKNPGLQKMFWDFRQDPSKWSLGVCNGDQAMMWLQWLYPEMADDHPLSVRNLSGAFESRWVNVVIPENTKAMMLKGMGGTKFGVSVAHGEGRFWSPNAKAEDFLEAGLVGMQYIKPDGQPAGEKEYPWNPSGSPLGIAGLCSADGNHLALMPHPERSYKRSQCHWLPANWKDLEASPWLKMFQNAREWCEQTR
ncbi:MAG: phosphoribosylformylglycinamidine synthase [Candidatus Moraniibacteriota bacterium]